MHPQAASVLLWPVVQWAQLLMLLLAAQAVKLQQLLVYLLPLALQVSAVWPLVRSQVL
jgi:hypothetical protein